MKKESKNFAIGLTSILMLFTLSINNINADETENTNHNEGTANKVCSVSQDPIPEEGESILLEDNTTYKNERGTITTVNVNKIYSIRIQNSSGSCVSSARVTLSGSYKYNSSTNKVSDVALYARMTSVPTLWTVSITSQWHNISGASLSHSIYYRCSVDDPFSCMVGGGYWYSGATFKIR